MDGKCLMLHLAPSLQYPHRLRVRARAAARPQAHMNRHLAPALTKHPFAPSPALTVLPAPHHSSSRTARFTEIAPSLLAPPFPALEMAIYTPPAPQISGDARLEVFAYRSLLAVQREPFGDARRLRALGRPMLLAAYAAAINQARPDLPSEQFKVGRTSCSR